MPGLLARLYSRLGPRYLSAYVVFETVSAMVICLATVALFSLYEDMTSTEFWEVVLVSELCVALAIAFLMARAAHLARPVVSWLRDGKPAEGGLEAWRTAVSLPRELVLRSWQPLLIGPLPISLYATLRLDLPAYSVAIIFAGAAVAVSYSAILHFFASELFLRPVVRDAAASLPPAFDGARLGVPLRWKLLGALPVINVVTGVVVSGLSTDGSSSLDDLGLDVVVALLVAFTISFELTLLVTRSVLRPVEDLLRATEAVKRGDFDARVPVASGDEMGQLAGSFNEMMEGVAEREALREAFGSYVDPDVAQRVLEEGELLEGRELEVTVMIVDVRDFTPFAQRSTARETVAFLNDLFGVVVPCVTEEGGHANKFLGDGLLAVFGAPEQMPDHADRALKAAFAIAAAVEARFEGTRRVGIGINSGPVVVGSVGGGGRLEFSVIGDPVNVAARVEAITRDTGDVILCTEATRCLLGSAGVTLDSRGAFELKGIDAPVPVYSATPPLDVRPTSHSHSVQADA